jgi:hypothetical protein
LRTNTVHIYSYAYVLHEIPRLAGELPEVSGGLDLTLGGIVFAETNPGSIG